MKPYIHQLAELVQYLNAKLKDEPCNNTHRHTRRFLIEKRRFRDFADYNDVGMAPCCDCEFVKNFTGKLGVTPFGARHVWHHGKPGEQPAPCRCGDPLCGKRPAEFFAATKVN